MAYAWAGPMGFCVQEATSGMKMHSRLQPKNSTRRVDNHAYSNGGPINTNAQSATGQATSDLWGLWNSFRASKTQKRVGVGLTVPSTSTEATAQSSLPTIDAGRNGPPSMPPGPSKEADPKQPKPLLNEFLSVSDQVDVTYAALLADLSDLAYDTDNVHLLPALVLERHNLNLVATSQSVQAGPLTRDAWYTQMKEQRGSLATRHELPAASTPNQEPQTEQARLSDAAANVAHTVLGLSHEPLLLPSVSMVALSTIEDVSPRTSLSGDTDIHVPIVTFMPSPPSSPRSSSKGSASSASQLDTALTQEGRHTASSGANPAAGQVPVTIVSHATVAEGSSSQAGALTTPSEPPAAWFACDDPITKIRYMVIQGSTTLDHWQINLQFEPVIFEDPALGVRVHRGVYMAALQLYDDLVPLVRQHLATSSFASVTFTGHSLGGSLASVLMLLMVYRGVLPLDCVSPTYTFGAPAVFCGGAGAFSSATRCQSCGLDCPEAHDAAQAATTAHAPQKCSHRPRGLFAQLGLGEDYIVNVIMHRDIVPRAFVCDYMAVADLLVQWMPSFKDLSTLQGPADSHKSLYSFLGRVAVLQPDPGCPFVHESDARHPFLPAAAGLYRLVAPAPRMRVHTLRRSFDLPTPAVNGQDLDLGGPLDAASMVASMTTMGRPRPYTPAPIRFATVEEEDDEAGSSRHRHVAPRRAAGSAPRSLKDAVLQFMNNPHPLTTLSEYGAYGPNGSISRYHNPRNYTLGLLALIGKAPHQQAPPPSSHRLMPSLSPPTTCSSAPSAAGGPDCPERCDDPAGLSAEDHMCSIAHEHAMSPEAQRLIKKPSGSPAHSRAVGRVNRGGAQVGPSHSSGPSALPGAPLRLSQLPGLSRLLSAVGYHIE